MKKLLAVLGPAVLLLFLVLEETLGQEGRDTAPVITINGDGDTRTVDIREDTPPGTEVFRLQAFDDRSETAIRYSVSPATYFRVNNSRDGRVYLIQRLDRELQTKYTIQVTASDGSSQTTHSLVVSILDVNDEPPAFEFNTYKTTISERAVVNTYVFDNIKIYDGDKSGSILQVVCERPESSQVFDPCDYFEMHTHEASNVGWVGRMILKKGIDFDRDVIQVPVQVWDGQHITRQSFEIQIRDEQNFPPRFTSALSGRIQEDMRSVMQ